MTKIIPLQAALLPSGEEKSDESRQIRNPNPFPTRERHFPFNPPPSPPSTMPLLSSSTMEAWLITDTPMFSKVIPPQNPLPPQQERKSVDMHRSLTARQMHTSTFSSTKINTSGPTIRVTPKPTPRETTLPSSTIAVSMSIPFLVLQISKYGYSPT